ncbi:DUF4199 domain-containing protein [uncultured Maribacter sp.]|uniref:DUF4199 domain-containing protein n=1 Tax=uncultured Maribacter sp. TaxID=431308 RepID=UPI00262734E1|nr:DUF4199 domain-containing protein [uncultured Maribacter sp.]
MEENKIKTGTFALRYGLLLGVIGITFGLMLFFVDMHYERGFAIQAIQIGFIAITIVIAIIQFKKANEGFLTLSDALKIGTGVALIGCILGLIYFFLLSNVIEPDYMDKMYEIGKSEAITNNPKLTEEQIDKGIEMQKRFAWVFYPIGLIINIIIGLIVGLVSGLIMKKTNNVY